MLDGGVALSAMLGPGMEKTSDIIPVTSYEAEFLVWIGANAATDVLRQDVVSELRAEHHIMDAVLAAMERETRRLSVHGDLRPDFWERVVDYLGNFTYLVHRRKEEQALFPALQAAPKLERPGSVAKLAEEHEQAKDLTMALVDGVSDGDWEKVLRAAHLYLRVARDHLEREEWDVFEPLVRDADEARMNALRTQFDEIEREALGDRDRGHYLAVARRLCLDAGLTDILDS